MKLTILTTSNNLSTIIVDRVLPSFDATGNLVALKAYRDDREIVFEDFNGFELCDDNLNPLMTHQ